MADFEALLREHADEARLEIEAKIERLYANITHDVRDDPDLRISLYALDHEHSVLCADCAEKSIKDLVPKFRPKGPLKVNTTIEDEYCDHCGAHIPIGDPHGDTTYF